MPTEDELDQMVNEHLDREKAVESIEQMVHIQAHEQDKRQGVYRQMPLAELPVEME